MRYSFPSQSGVRRGSSPGWSSVRNIPANVSLGHRRQAGFRSNARRSANSWKPPMWSAWPGVATATGGAPLESSATSGERPQAYAEIDQQVCVAAMQQEDVGAEEPVYMRFVKAGTGRRRDRREKTSLVPLSRSCVASCDARRESGFVDLDDFHCLSRARRGWRQIHRWRKACGGPAEALA